MKICAKCGGELSDFAVCCSYCGASLLAGGDQNDKVEKVFTDGSDTQGFGYGDAIVSTGKVKESKKKSILPGVVLFGLIIAALVFLSVKLYIKGQEQGKFYNEQTDVACRWINAKRNGDVDELLKLAYSNSVMAAAEKAKGMTHVEYVAYLNVIFFAQKNNDTEIKDIKVSKSSEIAATEFEAINKKIEEYTGEANVIEKMYNVTVTYQEKFDDEWEEKSESFRTYSCNGKLYIYRDIFGND